MQESANIQKTKIKIARQNKASKAMMEKIRACLDDGKAEDIIVFDIASRSALADYMIIAGGTSGRHVSSLADKVIKLLKEAGCKDIRTEGMETGDWTLIDEGDVIIHLFRPEARAFYRLEKIWADNEDNEAEAALA